MEQNKMAVVAAKRVAKKMVVIDIEMNIMILNAKAAASLESWSTFGMMYEAASEIVAPGIIKTP